MEFEPLFPIACTEKMVPGQMVGTIEIVVVASRITGARYFSSLPDWSDFFRNLPPSQQDQEWLFGPYSSLVQDLTSPNDLKRETIDACD